jgi:hypothetical protein
MVFSAHIQFIRISERKKKMVPVDDECANAIVAEAEAAESPHSEEEEEISSVDVDIEQGRIITESTGEDISVDASMTLKPPAQDVMEHVEEGDDDAPRPLNYGEFEDESKPKIELCEGSVDEDDGPPLPSITQASSLNSQNEAPDAAPSVDGNESAGGAETNPSVSILEAYLVEEEESDDGCHDAVYEATPLESELPWWKQRRTMKVVMIIMFLLIVLAIIKDIILYKT